MSDYNQLKTLKYQNVITDTTSNTKENVDIDKDTSGLAAQHKVSSVPTTVLIREDGSTVSKTGRLSKDELTELILS